MRCRIEGNGRDLATLGTITIRHTPIMLLRSPKMYRMPIVVAASVFAIATLIELFALEVSRGSVAIWLGNPHRIAFLTIVIGMNALQGALFGYAAHRAALNKFLRRRSEQEHRTLAYRLRSELQPALTIVQYAAYKTCDKQCIEICNEAINRVVNTVTVAGGESPDYNNHPLSCSL